ncbi:ElyC/SanA/YdcF family protein [Oscillospiraceae bacterium WX1]
MAKFARAALAVIIIAALIGTSAVFALNRIVLGGGDKIISESEAAGLQDVDCILILGCGVYNNRYPSEMLEDRLTEGVRLYKLGASDRILMSGDNSAVNYNEVKVMKDFAVAAGVPSAHVFQDHAGFSTYESMYRARDVFAAKKIIIVTQRYHMYRALYIAAQLGLDAYGVVSEPKPYAGQWLRDCREILARAKDFFTCIFKPEPTFLGEVIPVSGNGDTTD